jgi:hypothetical protein
MKRAFPIMFAMISLSGCSLLPGRSARCATPEDFSERDLVGTWVSKVNTEYASDTLVIRGDHTYRQVIELEDPAYHFESDWQEWELQLSDNQVAYLQLEGLRLYGYAPNLIDQGVVGGGDGWFIDFCQDPVEMTDGTDVYPGVQMPAGKGLLVVVSVPQPFVQPPRGIQLVLLPSSEASSWFYELEEP